jgi:RHS repeat-associated protein
MWSYSNFALGEVTQQQDSYTSGGTTIYKAPFSYTYYEPSGLYDTITQSTPGTVDSSTRVTYRYSYNSLGEMTQMTTPGNNAASTITDTLSYASTPQEGQILSATDNLGHSSTFTYDSQGNMTSRSDALGNTFYWGNTTGTGGYNIANQNILKTFPATGQTGTGNSSEATSYQYPGGPELSVQSFDESGNQVRQVVNTYGAEGELLTVSGSTEFTSYSYDAFYRIHSITDANGHSTNYYYNGQGYLDSITYPGYSGPTPTYNTATSTWSNITGPDSVRNASYDPAGDVLTRVDGRGVVTTYTYNDPENNLTNVSYNVSGTSVPAQPSVTLTYDGFGRMASINNGITQNLYGYTSGGTAYPGYDDDDNLLNVQTGFYASGSIAFSKNISYGYNGDGSKATTITPSGTFSYYYDAVGRPTSETNPFGETTSWSYLNNNWIAGQVLANGAATSYTHNAKALVTQLVNTNGSGSTLSNFSGMTYDGVGNRTGLTATVSSDTTFSGSTSFTYDGKNEMADESSTRNGSYNNTFAYDGAENPTTFRGVSGKTYNSNNQNSGSGYAFDGDGNPTTYSGSSFVFDAENRLTSVGTVLTAAYGTEGLRSNKTDSTGTTYYLYANGGNLPVCELSSSGTVTATNTYTANGLVSRNTSSGSIFYEFDPQGNVSERLNATGACTGSSTADALGVVTNSAAVSDPFGYIAQAGYYTDQSTGLVLAAHRYYDPGAGRFINRDPTGYEGGIDLYAYVQNSAENGLDPSGYGGTIEHFHPGTPGYPDPFPSPVPTPSPCPTCKTPCTPNKVLDTCIGLVVSFLVAVAMFWLFTNIPIAVNPFVSGCLISSLSNWAGQAVQNWLDDCEGPPSSDQVLMEVWTSITSCVTGGLGGGPRGNPPPTLRIGGWPPPGLPISGPPI